MKPRDQHRAESATASYVQATISIDAEPSSRVATPGTTSAMASATRSPGLHVSFSHPSKAPVAPDELKQSTHSQHVRPKPVMAGAIDSRRDPAPRDGLR